MKKIAFFDFCETLVQFQTADNFVDFVRRSVKSPFMNALEFFRVCLVKVRFFALANRLHQNNLHKKLKLLQMKNLPDDKVCFLAKQYYENEIKPCLINEMIIELKKKKRQGYFTVIISGGYEHYIRHFAEDFEVDLVVATDILSGRIDGLDCMGSNKIKKLKEYLSLDLYDLENSVAYSDSLSDLPLFELVGNPVAVVKESQKWANKYGYRKIIWN